MHLIPVKILKMLLTFLSLVIAKLSDLKNSPVFLTHPVVYSVLCGVKVYVYRKSIDPWTVL